MTIKSLKQVSAFVLAIAYAGQITAGVVAAQPKASTKWEANAAYVAKWNEVSKKWPKSHGEKQVNAYLKTVEAKFNPQFESEDKAFFITTSVQNEELPEMAKIDKGVVFTLKSDPSKKLEVVHVSGSKYLLNGKEFNYNVAANLDSNANAMGNLLAMDSTAQNSFLNQLFIPQAEAGLPSWGWALIAAAVVFIGINLYNNWGQAKAGAKQVHKGVHNLGEASLDPSND